MEPLGCVNHGWVTFSFNPLQDINIALFEKIITIDTIELDFPLCIRIERGLMSISTCPRCGAQFSSPPGSLCDYCGAEPAAKSALATSSILAAPVIVEPVSSLPPELAGLKRPKATGMSSLNSLVTLLFAIPWMLCISLSFLVLGFHFLNSLITYVRLSYEGVTVRGTVSKLEVEDSGDSASYDVYYRFSVPVNGDLIPFEDKDSVSESVYSKLETGGSVEVIYAESDPETSAVRLNWAPPDFWAPLFIFTLEFIGLAFGGWLLSIGIKAGKNNLNLHSKGQETPAIIFDRWEESGSDSSFYYVAYAYRVPGFGKQIFTNAEQSSDAYQKLKIGDTVSVRYLPADPKIVKLTGFN
jgi:hypothetical protein